MITNDLMPGLFLKMTRVIFFSLIGGLMFFLIAVLYITDSKFLFNLNISDPLLLSSFILTCVILPAGYMFTKMTFGKIVHDDLLKNKLTRYQSGQIIRLATCEGIGILAIVSLLLTSNLFFLFFLSIALFVMIQYYPTPDKIGREINLTQNEIDQFNNQHN
jgi:hypothetical protein